MNEEQRSFIRLVDNGSPDKVMVKDTGREGIDLAPHSTTAYSWWKQSLAPCVSLSANVSISFPRATRAGFRVVWSTP